MRIAVLRKQVPDTWGERRMDPTTGRADRDASDAVADEIDDRALELALHLREELGGAEIVLLTMGPDAAEQALRAGLALGADRAVHVIDERLVGADLLQTGRALAAALAREAFDLVLTGLESTDGRGGVLPAMLAERLGLPLVSAATSLEVAGGALRAARATEFQAMDVEVPLPAIVTVTERFPEARIGSFRGIRQAKKKPVDRLSLSDLALAPAPAASVVVDVDRAPERTAGARIVDDGTAAEAVADFLAERNLI
ncbi:electron transfer flavoprotein subunit beta [Agromyces rhizosphaerae]|uniref:Electron transfer flavoprotein subunit beta n=1 Tax=Agromyces rhizosphaerae TaxID=88374 RepID=A0A9W6CY11_9MICO|nr:electron transfer flavoprotein subunit beta/FixA family protein [Agromyces rhizosphaerae]GLI25928.1 electron transfer flavoprotein subunit beta [Agromyces rhizosphaerae]